MHKLQAIRVVQKKCSWTGSNTASIVSSKGMEIGQSVENGEKDSILRVWVMMERVSPLGCCACSANERTSLDSLL